MAKHDSDFKSGDLYYDLAKYETELVATQSNFLLVFQSMLFAAAVFAGTNPWFLTLLIILGLVSSILWLILDWATACVVDEALDRMYETDERLKNLIKSIRKRSWQY